MAVPTYTFAARQEFLNRRDDLRRMEEWWSSRSRDALVLYGRRRVGKSWLFREFAHGKPAIVLVSERRAQGAQLKRFARDLAPHLGGVEPALERPADLIAALYEIGRTQKVLVVIDELPYLLPSRAEHRNADLSAIQAVMEERDSSRLKLVLCGSHIGQMTSLLGEGSPLRGRVTPLPVRALRFAEAQPFIAAKSATERIERFAVSGGMSLYLDELGSGGPLARRIAERALDSRGPLFNDPREVLEDELREPGVYFSILEELGGGERSSTDIATATGKRTTDLGPYLATLSEMGLVEQRMPLGSKPGARDRRFALADDFLRFWFRFVFPFQGDLGAGLRPADHYAGEVAPALPDHVAPVFERLCREYARLVWGRRVSKVGAWWGPALHELRRSGERWVEEIDVVGQGRHGIALVGECKWTARKLSARVLDDLERHKIPALRQSGLKVTAQPTIALFSRSGFKQSLIDAAADRDDVRLIAATTVVERLLSGDG